MNLVQELHWKVLKEIIYEQVGCPPDMITPASRLIDLGFDSLDKVELVMGMEEEWGIDIQIEDSDKWEAECGTLQMILDYLEENADTPNKP